MKKFADLKRREVQFEVGRSSLFAYKQCSLARKRSEKLASKFYGPYEIVAKISEVSYHLKLPLETVIHNFFHVSQLKQKLGQQQQAQ